MRDENIEDREAKQAAQGHRTQTQGVGLAARALTVLWGRMALTVRPV